MHKSVHKSGRWPACGFSSFSTCTSSRALLLPRSLDSCHPRAVAHIAETIVQQGDGTASSEGCDCPVAVQALPRSAEMPMARKGPSGPSLYRPTGHAAGTTASWSRTSGAAGRLAVVPASYGCRWPPGTVAVRGRCCTPVLYAVGMAALSTCAQLSSTRAFGARRSRDNRQRDQDTDRQLAEAGWIVVRVWEHETRKPLPAGSLRWFAAREQAAVNASDRCIESWAQSMSNLSQHPDLAASTSLSLLDGSYDCF